MPNADADVTVESLMTILVFSTDVECHAINRVASSPTHAVRKVLRPKPRNCGSGTGGTPRRHR